MPGGARGLISSMLPDHVGLDFRVYLTTWTMSPHFNHPGRYGLETLALSRYLAARRNARASHSPESAIIKLMVLPLQVVLYPQLCHLSYQFSLIATNSTSILLLANMIVPTRLSSAVLALTSLTMVEGLAITYPEVVPGPGLPSLAELGLTSAELYNMGMPHHCKRA